MRRYMLFALGLLLLLAPVGCQKQAGAPAAPTVEPVRITAEPTEKDTPTVEPQAQTATPEPQAATVTEAPVTEPEPEAERILGHCLSIVDRLPYGVDMDGDGGRDMVDLVTYTGPDDYPRWAIVLIADGQEKRFETDVSCDTFCDLWVGDLDEDGAYELFFHGDLASDDYVIYGFRSDLSSLLFESDERAARWGGDARSNVYDGYIEGFEDGHIVIEGVVDMLGTHWGVRNFSIGEDGVIGPVSTVWAFEEDDDRFLTVTRELTAYKAAVRKDPGEPFLLEPGDRVYVLASDGCERMWFKTGDGRRTGVLLLTPDEENMWLIDGVPEAEYFETLPYAG